MAHRRGRSTSPQPSTSTNPFLSSSEDDSLISSRQLEAFGRTVHATASHLISANFPSSANDAGGGGGGGSSGVPNPYHSALSSVHQLSQRPMIQRSVFSLAKANPRELIRSKFNATEIEHRALAYLPDELLRNVPESHSPFSLFEGFKASLPPTDDLFGPRPGSTSLSSSSRKRRQNHHRRTSRAQGLLGASEQEQETGDAPPRLVQARRERDRLEHGLEMMGVRKSMFATEIREIDDKIANLSSMRKVVLDRLAGLEDEERELEQQVSEVSERVDVMEEEVEEAAAAAAATAAVAAAASVANRGATDAASNATKEGSPESDGDDASAGGFMSESIYGKLPKGKDSTKTRRKRNPRRITTPVLHEHMESGSQIRELHAHNDIVTALDFDAPFGTMVTAALDDTIRVWDLNAARCVGFLEGHLSSVRCLQVEHNLVATGSMDASIRLWDLNQADYHPPAASGSSIHSKDKAGDEGDADTTASASGEDLFTPTSETGRSPAPTEYHSNATADCHLFTLSAHVAEVTALNFHGSTLISGSADKTLRQWDLEKGRCVQTLDVLWAAAQASTIGPSANSASVGIPSPGLDNGGWWRPTGGRLQSAEADFVGAVQVFDAALACGTADGMVRLWDLRSGMVHRSLVGHTGPVTALQFDDVYLVTGSQDRSIRIWDLRTGNIHDAFAYDHPITSMQFDARRIVAAAGEEVVKVYDKTDGRQWDCGAGALAEADEAKPSIVERVRIKDGYLVEGRRDGVVGVWSC